MSKLSDQTYLLTHQYKDASNLNARVNLHLHFSTNKYGWHPWVFDQINFTSGSHILELGCGPGYLWLENLDRIAADWNITLSDFSPGMLTTAQQNLSHSPYPFKFEIVDAQTIPFDDKSFDIVIANHMLYHVPDKPKALSQIRRILKPGGRFYATTNSRTHLKELRELIDSFDPDIGASEQPFSISFGLENGQDQISAWFSSVTLRRYEDALIVTEAAPLIDYILSSSKVEAISHQREAFTGFIEQRLALQGSIYITKDAGLFEAF